MDENTAQQAPQEDEHPHDGRLRALLHRLVAEQGRMKAAKALGVDHKTVSRSLKSGRLTMLLRAALLTKALDEGLTALAAGTDAGGHAEEEEPADPADRIKELAGEVLEAREAVQALTGSAEQLHKEHGERLAEVERRLAAVEVPPPDTEGAAVIGAARADAGPAPAPARPRPRRDGAALARRRARLRRGLAARRGVARRPRAPCPGGEGRELAVRRGAPARVGDRAHRRARAGAAAGALPLGRLHQEGAAALA